MKDKAVTPAIEARVQRVLAQTDWTAKYPTFADRMTAFRRFKEAITARVLADVAQQQARRGAAQASEAAADVARWTNPGGRYGS